MVPVSLTAALDAFARGAPDDALSSFADDADYVEAGKPAVHGRAAIAAEFARFTATGVPFRFVVEDAFAGGNRACVEFRFAVATGTGGGWRERAGCATVRFDDRDHITEWREYEG